MSFPTTISLDSPIVREAAVRALGEDRGPCDITTLVFTPAEFKARARIFVKEPGVLAGVPVAQRVFMEQDPELTVQVELNDGALLEAGQTVFSMYGAVASILTAERCALNFLQHLSGIATRTRQFVDEIRGTRCQILDTRKTTPGLRHLEKYAVRCGGGTNHRFGLYDMFLVKDNHLAFFGESPGRAHLKLALERARQFEPDAPLEIEAETLEQVKLFLDLGVDRIMLDNMSNGEIAKAVALVEGRCKLEASGNMTLERVRSVAETGVDFISVGALTHSVRSLDFSLEITHAEETCKPVSAH